MMRSIFLIITLLVVALQGNDLVNLREFNPRFRFAQNLEAYLNLETAIRLSRVQEDLSKDGIALVILRAYVPQEEFPGCDLDPDNCKISHTFSRGTAVDVSLEYFSGNPLELPCPPYTWFIDPKYAAEPCPCTCALQKLERSMQRHGFVRSEKVWWHYEYKNWRLCPPIDTGYGR